MTRVMLVLTVISLSTGAASARAQTELGQEADIFQNVMTISAANKIRKECDEIRARFVRAYGMINDLKEVARERGYTDEEIDTFLNDKDEKARVRTARNAYFESKGASTDDAQSLCVLGREEIARKSQIGRLLKEK